MRWALAGSAGKTRGFTLIELSVVLVVLAVLAAISITTFTTVTERSRVAALDASLVSFTRAHTQALAFGNLTDREAAEQVAAEMGDRTVTITVTDVDEVLDLDDTIEGAYVTPGGGGIILAAGAQHSDTMYVVTAEYATGSDLCRQIVMPTDLTPDTCSPVTTAPTPDTTDPPTTVAPSTTTPDTTTTPPVTVSPAGNTTTTTTPPVTTTTTPPEPEVARPFTVMVRPVDNRIYWWHSFWDGSGGMGEWVAEFSFSNAWMRHQYLDLLVTRTHSNGTVSTETVTGFYVPGGAGAPSRSWSNAIGASFTVPHGITRVEVKVTRVVTSDEHWKPMESNADTGVSGYASMDWPSLPR